MNPRFSILTAAYNGSHYLPDLLKSIARQTFRDFEHLVINDGSTDAGATEAVLDHSDVTRWWTTENSGQYQAQNLLLREAQGEFVTIINQDDAYIDAEVLAEVAQQFDAEDAPDIVYGDVRFMDTGGEPLPYRYQFRGPRSQFLLRNVSCIHHIALFFRRSLVEQHQLFFDPEFTMAGDWDWNLRLFKASRRMVHIGRPIAWFRIHPAQKTSAIGERGFGPEVRTICRQHGIPIWLNSLLRHYSHLKGRLVSVGGIIKEEGLPGLWRRLYKKSVKR